MRNNKLFANKVGYLLLPFLESRFANKCLKKRKKEEETGPSSLSYIENIETIKLDVLKDQYNDTFEIKNRLEDKAKTNIAALTISISLILGLSNLINSIYSIQTSEIVKVLVFTISISAILYMVTAGIMSISVLIRENVVYKIRYTEESENEETKKEYYCKYYDLNTIQNTIRNNLIFSAYRCIRNGMVLLILLFFISTFPLFPNTTNKYTLADSETISNRTVVFELDAVKEIEGNTNIESVINIVEMYFNQNDSIKNGSFCIVDKKMNMVVLISLNQNVITIKNIEKGVFITEN